MKYRDLIVAQGATGYWQLEDAPGSSFITPTVGSTLGVYGTPTLQAPGTFGYGIANNGSTSYIGSSSTTGLDFTGSHLSYSLWVNFNSLSGIQGIISKRTDSSHNRHYSMFMYNTTGYSITIDLGEPSYRWDTKFIPPIDGKFHHYAFTYNGSTSDWCFYVDGILNATTNQSQSAPGVASSFLIGTLGGSTSSALNGSIDEPAVFSGVCLTATQIKSQYNSYLKNSVKVFDGTNWNVKALKVM